MSTQSRLERKQELTQIIQSELSRFKWLISGGVQIEFAWYLSSIKRQETDKAGDIDNITKPILDALTGPDGILIDDSQIGSVQTFWMSRNEQLSYNVLRLNIQFSSEDNILSRCLAGLNSQHQKRGSMPHSTSCRYNTPPK
ncbi:MULTISPECIES: RusA family crossover junction endodeoxyribonuclease [unclassified Pseudomonas]|uniref:RusA family crossover junction endodeoxyribonuclease n=1 Tax=unclassified Pseudomonas TaxID=196821 RepID=UPI001CBB906A